MSSSACASSSALERAGAETGRVRPALGVLHQTPDTRAALAACVRALKTGAVSQTRCCNEVVDLLSSGPGPTRFDDGLDALAFSR